MSEATGPDGFAHGAALSILARAEPGALKALAETLIDGLGAVEVVTNRTGLVMTPLRDSAEGVDFHLGETLVAEAHIRAQGVEGYGAVLGRDLERAMAMAVVDTARTAGVGAERIGAFLRAQDAAAQDADAARLREIEATRVEMETF